MAVAQRHVRTDSISPLVIEKLEDERSNEDHDVRGKWTIELKQLCMLAFPIMAYSALQFGMMITDQIMVGQLLGKDDLAAAALGNVMFDVVYFFLFGCGTALDTLASQAYGAGSNSIWRLWTKVALVSMSFLCIPAIVWLALGPQIAQYIFRQDEEIADDVGRFAQLLIIGVPPFVWGVTLQKALQARQNVNVPLGIVFICFCLNVVLNLLLIELWGFAGAPCATSFTRWAFFFLFVGYWYLHRRSLKQHGDVITRQLHQESSDNCKDQKIATAFKSRLRDVDRIEQDEQVIEPGGQKEKVNVDDDEDDDDGEGDVAGALAKHIHDVSNGTERNRLNPNKSSVCSSRGGGDQALIAHDEQSMGTIIKGFGGNAKAASVVSDVEHGDGVTSLLTSSAVRNAEMTEASTSSPPPPPPRQRNGASSLSMMQLVGDVHGRRGGGGGEKDVVVDMAVTKAEVKVFSHLAVTGGMMMLIEAMSFSITTALAGGLGQDEVAATSVMLLTSGFLYFTAPFGMAMAISVHVGSFLGAGRPQRAEFSSKLAMIVVLMYMTSFGIILWVFGDVIGYMFTSDEQVVALVAKIAPYGAINTIADGVQGVSGGILRGMGKQRHVLIVNFCGMWGVGVILGYILTFPLGLGLQGLWIGIASGVLATAVFNSLEVLRSDWAEEALRAQAMVKSLSTRDFGGTAITTTIHLDLDDNDDGNGNGSSDGGGDHDEEEGEDNNLNDEVAADNGGVRRSTSGGGGGGDIEEKAPT